MRVLMNMQSARGPRTGVGHYTWELARAIRAVGGVTLRTYPTAWEACTSRWYERQSGRFEAAAVGAWTKRVRGIVLRMARAAGAASYTERLSRTAAHGNIDLYHEPFFIPHECCVPTVATVHDLSVLLHPEWHRPDTVELFEKRFREGLSRCSRLIAISEFTKSEIVRHLGWPADRVSVTHMGIRPGLRRIAGHALAQALGKLNLREGYLLHVGTLEPRKNLAMLIRSYCSLPGEVREQHPLILAGGAGWNSEQLHAFLRSEGRDANIRWLGYVKDEEFAALYSGAQALVFPTFYEGFGIPTIEMMACGGAVLASTTGAVAETVGGKAHLIDPHDEAGWRDAMHRVCIDDEWQGELRKGAEKFARRFSWQRCADETMAAYHSALGERSEHKKAA